MDYTLGLLVYLFSVLRMGTAAPLPGEVDIRRKVADDVDRLITRMDNSFTFPDIIRSNQLPDRIGGISSILVVLEGYNNLIPNNFTNVDQIKTDISMMAIYLTKLSERQCKGRPRPEAPGWLQRLQTETHYVETHTVATLMGLKEFLNLLRKDLNVLKTC
ncbi:leptin-like [Odontesthes bonariensis]|uniref:leptin-like n=1 Tax=Odontesthes bonariensis TaxID=219752 RepID=UPI003F587AAC